MADGFDIHHQKSVKQRKDNTLQDHCRAAVLGAVGLDKVDDLSKELNLPASLIDFLTKEFGSSDFFIKSEEVTAEDITAETYNAVCKVSKQSVMLTCIPNQFMQTNEKTIEKWANEGIPGVQKCLISFNEGQKTIFVLQGGLKNLKNVINDMTKKCKESDEGSVWDLLKKIVTILQAIESKNMHCKGLEVSKICLDKSGDVLLYNPITYITGNANNDPFAVSEIGASAIYTPPEVISGDEPVLNSTSWVLGCILYEVVMRKPAYKTDGSDIFTALNDVVEGRKPEGLPNNFSKDLQATIWSCLQVQMQERPTLAELLIIANEQSKNRTSRLKSWLL